MSEAFRIYQSNLDAVSAAIMAGDYIAIRRHLGIPNMMSTTDREIVMTSVEEFDLVMMDFREELIAKGMIDYRRTCIEAKFVAGRRDMVAGRHHTEVVLKNGTSLPRYENHSVIMRIDGNWMGIWLESAMDNSVLQLLSPDIAAAQAQARRILERSGHGAA